MKLNDEPFEMIKSGRKTFELRLCDEKRQLLSVGDEIEFTHAEDFSRTILAEVVALHRFPSFEALFASLPLLKCGYTEETLAAASHTDMSKYYSKEEEAKFGVVAIEIKLK